MDHRVSISYYFSIWVKTTLLATATGLIVGYLVFTIYGVPIVTVCGFLWGQWVTFSHYWGHKRGQFEYDYNKYCTLKKAKEILTKVLGWWSCQSLYFSEFGEISWSSGEAYDEILKKSDIENGDRFFIYIRAAEIALRNRKYEKTIDYLEKAKEVNPSNIIANFMIAQSYERIGEAEKAILTYESALKDPLCESSSIKEYINQQVEKIKTKGPSKKPPMPGLRHLGLGR